MIFKAWDALGFPYLDKDGDQQVRILTGGPGTVLIFPTSTVHYGISHSEFNEGKAEAPWRRRMFLYFDMSTVNGKDGEVDTIPHLDANNNVDPNALKERIHDYDLKVFKDVPSIATCHALLLSEKLVLKRPVPTQCTINGKLVMSKNKREFEEQSKLHTWT